MMLRQKNNMPISNQSGFAMVWATLLLIVASITAVTYVNYVEMQERWGSVQNTQDSLDDVIGALTAFQVRNGYLPCPASLTEPWNNVAFGVARNLIASPPANVCAGTDAGNDGAHTAHVGNIRIGFVPTRSLGIPANKARDEWGNRIMYAVTKSKTIPATYPTTYGQIILENATGSAIHSNLDYYVFSQGPQKLGAYRFSAGTQIRACTGTALETENCDNGDAVFVKTDYLNY